VGRPPGGGGWSLSGGGRECLAWGPAVNETRALISGPGPKRIKNFDFFLK
jgi:hypothetical protein